MRSRAFVIASPSLVCIPTLRSESIPADAAKRLWLSLEIAEKARQNRGRDARRASLFWLAGRCCYGRQPRSARRGRQRVVGLRLRLQLGLGEPHRREKRLAHLGRL